MLFGFLSFLFVLACLLLILVVLLQKGKGSMGIGSMGGNAQMLFGGSGGQDLFQKITWILGAIIIAGSLTLALIKKRQVQKTGYTHNIPTPTTPYTPFDSGDDSL